MRNDDRRLALAPILEALIRDIRSSADVDSLVCTLVSW